jgi:hypothetical protein
MKNLVIVILSIVSVGALYYGYTARVDDTLMVCESEKDVLIKQSEQYRTESAALQKMYDQLTAEMQVQRVICEEQLKAMKSDK